MIAEWLANHRILPSDDVEDSGYSVPQLIVAYVRFAKTYDRKNGKPTDELAGVKLAMKHLRYLYEDLPLDEFGPVKLKAVRQRMIDAGNSRGYINQCVGRVRRCFKWGVAEEWVPSAIYDALAKVPDLKRGKCEARETENVPPVPNAVMAAMIPHLRGEVADLVRLQRLTHSFERPCRATRAGLQVIRLSDAQST